MGKILHLLIQIDSCEDRLLTGFTYFHNTIDFEMCHAGLKGMPEDEFTNNRHFNNKEND